MNKFYLIIIILLITNIFFANENNKDNIQTKRTILILPFLNKNKIEKYNYLSDTLMSAVKANIINSEKFNISSPNDIEKLITDSGFTPETVIKPINAIKIAKLAGSDIVITGKYIIIEDDILIQIEALDVINGKIVAISNAKGKLGLELLRIIDDASKEMSKKMLEIIPELEETYSNYITLLNTKKYFKLTNLNKSGIILTSLGASFTLIGLSIFIYDLAGYSNTLTDFKNRYDRDEVNFEDYHNSYYIFISLFSVSLAVSIIGVIALAIGIPFIFIKKKNNISFNITAGKSSDFYLSIKL